MNTFTVVLAVALCVLGNKPVLGWEGGLRDFILDAHNKLRREAGGCQINKLVYDEELEKQADAWVNKCVWKHENIQGRGENLAWNSHHNPEKDMIQHAMTAWYDEIKLYSWGQRSCARSCHYTQLVWHNTQKVGCSTHRCPNLVNAAADSWFLACFYTPMGNWNGEEPFKKTCDKPCLEGQTAENGLCVGEPKGEDSVVKKCEDKVARCEGWAKKGQCEKNPSYMKKSCPVSCKECEGEKFKADENLPACHDEDEGCATWAKNGLCTKNAKYMGNHCKKSCKKC